MFEDSILNARLIEIEEYERTHPVLPLTAEEIEVARQKLQAVEDLLTNEMGKNNFYRWLKEQYRDNPPMMEAMSLEPQSLETLHVRPSHFIFTVLDMLEGLQDEAAEEDDR